MEGWNNGRPSVDRGEVKGRKRCTHCEKKSDGFVSEQGGENRSGRKIR